MSMDVRNPLLEMVDNCVTQSIAVGRDFSVSYAVEATGVSVSKARLNMISVDWGRYAPYMVKLSITTNNNEQDMRRGRHRLFAALSSKIGRMATELSEIIKSKEAEKCTR